MAEGKKSFILYCDIKHTVDHLTDQQAGKLFKHIIAYVNDLDPQTEDIRLKLAFEPIKQQLKRDLKQWEGERSQRSESGRIGGLRSGEVRKKQNEAKRSTASKNEANEAVTVNVTVNDNVTVKNNTVRPDEKFLLDLPEQKINTAIEYLSRTQKAAADKPLILSLWTVFKEKNFTGEKIYKSNADIFRHFFETLKFEKINGHQSTSKGGKHAGALQLVESLKQDYARGKENP